MHSHIIFGGSNRLFYCPGMSVPTNTLEHELALEFLTEMRFMSLIMRADHLHGKASAGESPALAHTCGSCGQQIFLSKAKLVELIRKNVSMNLT